MKRFLVSVLVFLLVGATCFADVFADYDDYPKFKIRIWTSNNQWYSGVNGLFQDILGPETLLPNTNLYEFLNGLSSQFPGLSWARGQWSHFIFYTPANLQGDFVDFLENHKASSFGGSDILLYLERSGEIARLNGKKTMALDFGVEFENNLLLNFGIFIGGSKATFQTVYGEKKCYVAGIWWINQERVDASIQSGDYWFYRRDFTLKPHLFNFSFQKGLPWNKKHSLVTYAGAGIEFLWFHLSWDEYWERNEAYPDSGSWASSYGSHYDKENWDHEFSTRLYFVLSQKLRLLKGLNIEIEYRRTFYDGDGIQFDVFDHGMRESVKVGNLRPNNQRLLLGISFEFY